jgi:hypothetical protein
MVPSIVWVEPAPKVRVSALDTVLVRLLNVVDPEMAWPVPSRVTFPELWANVPPEWLKSPETLIVPLVAVKLPSLTVNGSRRSR